MRKLSKYYKIRLKNTDKSKNVIAVINLDIILLLFLEGILYV